MNKGFTIIEILIAVFVIALIGGGGYTLYTKSSNTEPEETATASENSIDSESPAVRTAKDEKEPAVTADSPDAAVIKDSSDQPIVEEVVPEPTQKSVEDTGGPDSSGGNEGSEPIPEQTSEPATDQNLELILSPLWQHVLENIYTGQESESEPTPAPEPEPVPDPEPSTPQTVTVTYANSGFSPKKITINQGDNVLFVNNSTHSMWVSSDLHPTHTQYPEKSSGDCFGSSFDSCANISPDSSWQFQFNSIGSWGYHNHTRPGKTGAVVVQ